MAEASSTPSAAVIPNRKGAKFHVRQLGLTRIDGHPEGHPYIADVVFVHGLQGHPQRTWQSKSPTKSPKRLRDRFKKITLSANDGETQQHDRLFWPADILPKDFKDIRILTYGYDSMVKSSLTDSTSKNGIFQHGKSLLGALSSFRINCIDRPLIFVAHSLGGSPFASWGGTLKDVARAAQFDINGANLTDLDPYSGSSKLEELMYDFNDVLSGNQRAEELRIFSFQEEKGVGLLGQKKKVVPDESSSLEHRKYGSGTIHANHMEMCRFDDEDDDGYQKFSGVLREFIEEIKVKQENKKKMSLGVDAKRIDDLLQSLDYAERRSREKHLQNPDAIEESFSWIWLSSSSFSEWWSSSGGLYWMTGKPGSGKSTLIEYLVNKYEQEFKLQQTVLHFFFDFRGGKGVTNNFEGLLRSLLHQLIENVPQVIDSSEKTSVSSCSERTLRNLLRTALGNAKKGVCIFVDGLDEYEGSILDIIVYLRNLVEDNDGGETSVKICVSSRPEPIPSQLLQGLPKLLISDHNQSGVQQYCQSALENLKSVPCDDLDVQQLSHIVAGRAEGVFLWARFALDQIVLGHSNGETFDQISKRLDDLPGEVEKIYERMLSRMEPLAKKECRIMLQLVCFARTNLSWQELLVGTDIAMDEELVIHERLCGDKNYNTFAKRLRAKAVGLLELVKGGRKVKVKLIHKSVNTYLNQKGWQVLGEPARIELVSHSLYVQICLRFLHRLLRYLNMEKNTDRTVLEGWFNAIKSHLSEDSRSARSKLQDSRYPLLDYAPIHIFRHAKLLEDQGVSSYPLLHDGLTEQLLSLHVFGQFHPFISECTCCYHPFFREFIFDDFDSCHVAFFHGLVLYCKDDLATRLPAPGQLFWERALRCAIHSFRVWGYDDKLDLISLSLQNVLKLRQCHLEDLVEVYGIKYATAETDLYLPVARSVLSHESVKDLRLVDSNGQEFTLLWFLTSESWLYCSQSLVLFVDVANSRGEDLRERCGPDGNVVETLLKQERSFLRRSKLQLLHDYYESRSWPFDYDLDEIEKVTDYEKYTTSSSSWITVDDGDDDGDDEGKADEDKDDDEDDNEEEDEEEEWEDEEEEEVVEKKKKEKDLDYV